MKGIRNLAVAVVIALAGCQGSDDPAQRMSAADQAASRQLRSAYELARSHGDWLGAEARADELRQRFPDSEAEQAIAPTLAEVRKQAEAMREAQRLREAWTYQSVAADGGAQRTATLYSRTPPAEEGMPVITPDAQLVLRDHPAWGRSAYLLLAQSHFSCPAPCAMQVAFDGGVAKRYAGKQADSGKGPALFIEDDAGFVKALDAAHEVKIVLPEGSGAVRTLVFEVGGFDPARYAKP